MKNGVVEIKFYKLISDCATFSSCIQVGNVSFYIIIIIIVRPIIILI